MCSQPRLLEEGVREETGGAEEEEKPFLTHCLPWYMMGTQDKAPRLRELHDAQDHVLLIQDRPRQEPGGRGSGERASRGQRDSSAGSGVGRFW